VTSIGIALPIFIVYRGCIEPSSAISGWPALLAVARAIGVYGLLDASVFTAIGIKTFLVPLASSSQFSSSSSSAHLEP